MHPIYNYIKQSLHGLYSDGEVSALSKWIATEVLGLSTVDLYAGKDSKFQSEKVERLEYILERLKLYEPLQYILGEAQFDGLSFRVSPAVLIPRPETAELVAWIAQDYSHHANPHILDIGTGSGCIPVSLARRLPCAKVSAWDISADALAVARSNAQANGVEVDFSLVDVLGTAIPDARVDVLVSNPPYITEMEKADMERNVTDWEPDIALFVPDDNPLLFYRRIAELGLTLLNSGGALYFEINRAYGCDTVCMMEQLGYTSVCMRKDDFGNDRMVKGILK